MVRVLFVEQNIKFRSNLSGYMTDHGFEVIVSSNMRDTWKKIQEYKPELCLLGTTRPQEEIFSIAKLIKQNNEKVPIVFLDKKGTKRNILRAFKLGSEDYITSPFYPEVLVILLNEVVKRSNKVNSKIYSISSTSLNTYTHELTCSGECIHISPREAFLLKYLMANKNKVLKREDILKELWGKDDYYMGRSMDVFISRVRKHISSDKGVSIINIRGTGFILKEHNDSENS